MARPQRGGATPEGFMAVGGVTKSRRARAASSGTCCPSSGKDASISRGGVAASSISIGTSANPSDAPKELCNRVLGSFSVRLEPGVRACGEWTGPSERSGRFACFFPAFLGAEVVGNGPLRICTQAANRHHQYSGGAGGAALRADA